MCLFLTGEASLCVAVLPAVETTERALPGAVPGRLM